MKDPKPISLGLVAISVIMFFAALATDIFWLARLIGKSFPPPAGVDRTVYDAFAVPDIVLSLILYIGAFGLILRKRIGFVASWVAMGMWTFDALLVLGLTKSTNVAFIGLSLAFVAFSINHLWRRWGAAE
jgi:hypothetical protein